jgi:hypothetical protein
MSSKSSLEINPIIDEGDYYTEVNGYQVPQNIRHRFRSTITAELLSDKDKVERDKNDLEYVIIKKQIPIYHRSQITLPSSNSDYTKMSNDLRTTVCHGHPVQRRSHSKTVHNEEIFKDYDEHDKKLNLYRRKKDWLGRWTEANIIRDRLYKNILEAQKKTTTQ